MATIDGKYKMSVDVEYEIKSKKHEIVFELPIKKRIKQVKKLEKYLDKLKSLGWDISTIEVRVDEQKR